jgi:AcrB/AcrD/AcrF family
VFPLCVLLVFMVLAALYESLSLPLVLILIVPMCLFSALVGVRLAGSENNIFTQTGLIVLVARLQERHPDRGVCARTRGRMLGVTLDRAPPLAPAGAARGIGRGPRARGARALTSGAS